VGSRDEKRENRGITHFLEHMLFKGTQNRNAFEIAHSLESLGGGLDAFTSRDMTCYYARCLDEHANVALDVLSDMLLHSVLDPEEIEKEKRVVLEEIQSVEDTPDDLIHDLFAQTVWGQNPVGEPILGCPDTVQGFSQQRLQSYLQQNYRPERIVIAAAGHLDHDHIVETVEKGFVFSCFEPMSFKRLLPEPVAQTRRHYRRDIGQTHICLGTSACAYTNPRRFDQFVANSALGEGMSSRLFQEIRERRGLAYSVYSYLDMLEDTGLFGTYMACDSTRVEQAVDIVMDQLFQLKQNGLTSAELASAKAQLKGELILGQESMDKRMGHLAQQEIYFGANCTAEESLANFDRVSQDSVIEVCQTMIDLDQMHRVTVGP
jgi:predicted Zn-dependent peptidase